MGRRREETADAYKRLVTDIARWDAENIWVRGKSLTDELMGHVSFTQMIYLVLTGRLPSNPEERVLDAVLVTLVEHGLTPSALVARVTYGVSPESIQGAFAAGLLGAGSLILGSVEASGKLLTEVAERVSAGESRAEAITSVVARYRAEGQRIPGIGHSIHVDDDPRSRRLFAIASECALGSHYAELMCEIAAEAEKAMGRKLPINATGAIAALLLEIGMPWTIHRGFALISRAAGLLAHIYEEQQHPITPAFRQVLREAEGERSSPGGGSQ